ncbi:MAG: hypothetical protein QM813_07235 [Verrucomicrobiota bacterium]
MKTKLYVLTLATLCAVSTQATPRYIWAGGVNKLEDKATYTTESYEELGLGSSRYQHQLTTDNTVNTGPRYTDQIVYVNVDYDNVVDASGNENNWGLTRTWNSHQEWGYEGFATLSVLSMIIDLSGWSGEASWGTFSSNSDVNGTTWHYAYSAEEDGVETASYSNSGNASYPIIARPYQGTESDNCYTYNKPAYTGASWNKQDNKRTLTAAVREAIIDDTNFGYWTHYPVTVLGLSTGATVVDATVQAPQNNSPGVAVTAATTATHTDDSATEYIASTFSQLEQLSWTRLP